MIFHLILKVLVIIGGLNWGLVGVTNQTGKQINIVEWFGVEVLNTPIIADSVYILVGLAAIGLIIVEVMQRNG